MNAPYFPPALQRIALLFIVCLTLLLGCNRANGPGTIPVSGTITYKGQPVDGAIVQFKPTSEESANTAVGKSNADGTFELTTREFSGAVAGNYQISVIKYESKKNETTAKPAQSGENVEEQAYTPPSDYVRPAPGPKNLLPAKYADTNKSGLTAEVTPSGPNEFNLELVD